MTYINIHTLPDIIHTAQHSINIKGTWWSQGNNSGLMHKYSSELNSHSYICVCVPILQIQAYQK